MNGFQPRSDRRTRHGRARSARARRAGRARSSAGRWNPVARAIDAYSSLTLVSTPVPMFTIARRPVRRRARTRRRRRRRTRSRGSGSPSPKIVGRRPSRNSAREDRDDAGLAVRVLAGPVDVRERESPCTRGRGSAGSSGGSRRPPSSRRRTATPGAAGAPPGSGSARACRRACRPSSRTPPCATCRRRAPWQTLSEPRMLTSASNCGRATDTRTSACAARWKTTSGRRDSTRSDTAALRTSIRWNEKRRSPTRARIGEVGETPAREIVDDVDRPAVGQQPIGQRGPDEAGAAGDETLHTAPLIESRTSPGATTTPSSAVSRRDRARPRAPRCRSRPHRRRSTERRARPRCSRREHPRRRSPRVRRGPVRRARHPGRPRRRSPARHPAPAPRRPASVAARCGRPGRRCGPRSTSRASRCRASSRSERIA